MAIPWPRVLVVCNVLVLVALLLGGIDWYVRWRVGQGLNSYHQAVIVPMTTPRPAPPPAAGPPAARP
jgi:hypothetical protein